MAKLSDLPENLGPAPTLKPLASIKKSEYYFAPIAFIIQTEVEHHDIFKEILLLLFESIRQPEKVSKSA